MRRSLSLLVALAAALALAPAALAAPPAPGTPDLDASSDTGTSSTDNITGDSTPEFTVDAGSAQAGMTVELYAQLSTAATATLVGSAVVPASGIVSVGSSPLSSGTYAFTALTDDGAEASAESAALGVTVDLVAPLLLNAPFLVDFIGSNSTLTFTSTPRIGVQATTGAVVTLYEGTTALGSATAADGLAVVTPSPLSEGSHAVHARAADAAGNVSLDSEAVSIRVDTTAPASNAPDLVDDDGASADDNYTSNPRPRFAVAAEAGARVTLFEEGVALGSAVADSSGVATVKVRDMLWLDPGMHCLYAIAIDDVGNPGAESAGLCVTIAPGVEPFTANLGLALEPTHLALSLRSTASARASVRVLQRGRTVGKIRRALRAGESRTLRVWIPPRLRQAKRYVVVATLRGADRERIVIRRAVRR